jgi:hypothetical protein
MKQSGPLDLGGNDWGWIGTILSMEATEGDLIRMIKVDSFYSPGNFSTSVLDQISRPDSRPISYSSRHLLRSLDQVLHS